jgi:SAM-dependent methyltransferase
MKLPNKKYLRIVSHYESCLKKHGDSHLGVDWPKVEDVGKRYGVMLDVVREKESHVSLLDFGCGASHLYDYIVRNNIVNINYNGLDISSHYIDLCRNKYPSLKYYCLDILNGNIDLPKFDYIIMNGVFTEKRELSYPEMYDYFQAMLLKTFSFCTKGIAFNVMSTHVDWERSDLFHLPLDELANFLTKEVSRNFIIRNDYGLYEYTTYIYR